MVSLQMTSLCVRRSLSLLPLSSLTSSSTMGAAVCCGHRGVAVVHALPLSSSSPLNAPVKKPPVVSMTTAHLGHSHPDDPSPSTTRDSVMFAAARRLVRTIATVLEA